MSPFRKPMPSFTLVLTSGHRSLLPTVIQFDSSVSPTMLPTAPDYLMRTIDSRNDAKDAWGDAYDVDADARTIFEPERPPTVDYGAEKTSHNSIKNLLLFLRKLVSYKRNNEPLVVLKPSSN